MNFENVDFNTYFEIIKRLKYPDIMRLCQANHLYHLFCQEDIVWQMSLHRDFPNVPFAHGVPYRVQYEYNQDQMFSDLLAMEVGKYVTAFRIFMNHGANPNFRLMIDAQKRYGDILEDMADTYAPGWETSPEGVNKYRTTIYPFSAKVRNAFYNFLHRMEQHPEWTIDLYMTEDRNRYQPEFDKYMREGKPWLFYGSIPLLAKDSELGNAFHQAVADYISESMGMKIE